MTTAADARRSLVDAIRPLLRSAIALRTLATNAAASAAELRRLMAGEFHVAGATRHEAARLAQFAGLVAAEVALLEADLCTLGKAAVEAAESGTFVLECCEETLLSVDKSYRGGKKVLDCDRIEVLPPDHPIQLSLL